MAYRVDNLPWFLIPLVIVYAYTIATIIYLISLFVHYTCQITFEEKEFVADAKQNFIFCHWHEAIPFYFAVFIKQNRYHVWMNHPLWLMKPVHVFLSFIGIKKIIMGSSGHDGKKALLELAKEIKNGASTFIFPDGPAGPPKQIKSGIIDLSYQTQVPIIPIEYNYSKYIQLQTWDKKKIPLPFSKIIVRYKAPIYVTDKNKNEVAIELAKALGLPNKL